MGTGFIHFSELEAGPRGKVQMSPLPTFKISSMKWSEFKHVSPFDKLGWLPGSAQHQRGRERAVGGASLQMRVPFSLGRVWALSPGALWGPWHLRMKGSFSAQSLGQLHRPSAPRRQSTSVRRGVLVKERGPLGHRGGEVTVRVLTTPGMW